MEAGFDRHIGPWADEPDQKTWELDGLNLAIRRHHSLGSLCGYVGVTADHPLFGNDYDDDFPGLRVHGGVTYSDDGDGDYLPSGWWWVGFDCAHSGDWVPAMDQYPGDTYKDWDFVQLQVVQLANQIGAMAQEAGR